MKNLYRLVPSGSGEIEDEVIAEDSPSNQRETKNNLDNGHLQMRTSTVDTLMVDPDTGAIIPIVELQETDDAPASAEELSELNLRSLFTVFLLFFINLINYIDRYTTAGVLKEIIQFYHIPDSQAGLLQVS